ncbi:MAG TPA: hypothetical protein VN688_08825 [Gemmataceae bacterium]|nr:hypothetical protein [Gemmataceae bacterium]
MDKQANRAVPTPPIDPVMLPDVATEPHPSTQAVPPEQGVGQGLLQATLPEIQELAKKVGGFKNLSDIAEQLDQASK